MVFLRRLGARRVSEGYRSRPSLTRRAPNERLLQSPLATRRTDMLVHFKHWPVTALCGLLVLACFSREASAQQRPRGNAPPIVLNPDDVPAFDEPPKGF